jgi:hypothetical protein
MVLWLVWTNLVERKNNRRTVLGIEKIFAFQLAVLHAASGVYAGSDRWRF